MPTIMQLTRPPPPPPPHIHFAHARTHTHSRTHKYNTHTHNTHASATPSPTIKRVLCDSGEVRVSVLSGKAIGEGMSAALAVCFTFIELLFTPTLKRVLKRRGLIDSGRKVEPDWSRAGGEARGVRRAAGGSTRSSGRWPVAGGSGGGAERGKCAGAATRAVSCDGAIAAVGGAAVAGAAGEPALQPLGDRVLEGCHGCGCFTGMVAPLYLKIPNGTARLWNTLGVGSLPSRMVGMQSQSKAARSQAPKWHVHPNLHRSTFFYSVLVASGLPPSHRARQTRGLPEEDN